MSIGILGLKTQTMAGRTANKVPAPYFTAFNPGDTAWTCPATAYYTFTLRGAGSAFSGGSNGGGSGAASQVTALLFTGQIVTFVVGRSSTGNGENTVVTFPSGKVVTAGGGVGVTGGTATGGDLNVSGLPAVGGLGGFGPAIGKFGAVPTAIANFVYGPSAGGGTNGGGTNAIPGPGILYLQLGKPPK